MNMKNKLKQVPKSWYFLICILIIYLAIFLVNENLFFTSIAFFNRILLKIAPVFVLVFVLMSLANYFITPEFVIKHLSEKKIRKWFFVVVGGVLSTGPIYMWYPLLADLKNRGLNYGLIACFLYNRAIKLPLLPIAIFYFGMRYVIVLSFVMVLMSVVQGMLINKLMEVKK